jgi:membrane fusion protein, multidrug efflux system
MEPKFQRRVSAPDTLTLTDPSRLVGARGANAAQRAAQAFHLISVGPANKNEVGPGAPEGAQPANARHQSENPAGRSGVSTEKPGSLGPRHRLALIGAAVAIGLAAVGWYGNHWLTVGRFIVSTDDAYVRADATTLAAKVSGYVSRIDVQDNTYVHAGDVIARIDDGDYQLAADAAADKLATQGATVERIGRQIEAQKAVVEQAKAQLASAQAVATRTQSELQRQQALAEKQFASRQTLEQAQANRDQAVASVQAAQAALEAASATVDVLATQQQEAARQQQELQTALAKAERDLKFTLIRAPIEGVIGNRAMRVGDYVQTGQRLASLVPLSEVYIDANFKETQLAHLKPGQPVSISVDALANREINGTVTSVSPASGAVFSLLPPDNATGNFTKIVQRLAVRISIPSEIADERLLRPGMSVVANVNTKSQSAIADTGSRSAFAEVGPQRQTTR